MAVTVLPHGASSAPRDARCVFVAHGRDERARGAMFGLLYTAGLKPESMPRAVRHAPSCTPFTLDAVECAMRAAQAIVVVMAAEEETALVSELALDGDDERGLQPRPNVFVELGMALLVARERVIVVEAGSIRSATNLDGLNVVRIRDTYERRRELLHRLESAGCPVDWDTEWASPTVTGSFEPPVLRSALTGGLCHAG